MTLTVAEKLERSPVAREALELAAQRATVATRQPSPEELRAVGENQLVLEGLLPPERSGETPGTNAAMFPNSGRPNLGGANRETA